MIIAQERVLAAQKCILDAQERILGAQGCVLDAQECIYMHRSESLHRRTAESQDLWARPPYYRRSRTNGPPKPESESPTNTANGRRWHGLSLPNQGADENGESPGQ